MKGSACSLPEGPRSKWRIKNPSGAQGSRRLVGAPSGGGDGTFGFFQGRQAATKTPRSRGEGPKGVAPQAGGA